VKEMRANAAGKYEFVLPQRFVSPALPRRVPWRAEHR
jgi:hypothetical protein